MKVVAITGSREWSDRAAIERVLAGAELLLVGDCPGYTDEHGVFHPGGADLIATEIAVAWDLIVDIYCAGKADEARLLKLYGKRVTTRLCADWEQDGKYAGPRRNETLASRAAMEKAMHIDVECHAFVLPSSVGTVQCMNRMRVKGLEVEEHYAV